MIRVSQAVVVEGKYDAIRLSSLIDGLIIPTNGFGIFKDKEKLALLRRLAVTRGIVVLTDSDGAGQMIRNRIKTAVTKGQIFHAYIPEVPGKEKRKTAPSAAGTLGVEGMTTQVLLQALERAGVTHTRQAPPQTSVTKADFMAWGLAGGKNSAGRRKALLKKLELPTGLSANTMLEVLSGLYDRETIRAMAAELPE